MNEENAFVEISHDEGSNEATKTKTYSEKYVRELRAEAANRRKEAEALQDHHKTEIETLHSKLTADFEDKLKQRDLAHRERAATAEIKAMAIKANVIDPDVLKLMDRSAAKFNADGEITNAAELVEAFRSVKPHLFNQSTSVAASVPQPKPPVTNGRLDWSNMSAAEIAAHKKSFGIL